MFCKVSFDSICTSLRQAGIVCIRSGPVRPSADCDLQRGILGLDNFEGIVQDLLSVFSDLRFVKSEVDAAQYNGFNLTAVFLPGIQEP